uniref:Uncharacterized protein n=1 Tax=Nelumbo nucifera TaxID=4432 RepID=A0A822YXI8_NELNU|nr:TPA_asm: hypothetical protein HUJ06_007861 [Nelumbo nucifera]
MNVHLRVLLNVELPHFDLIFLENSMLCLFSLYLSISSLYALCSMLPRSSSDLLAPTTTQCV